MKKNTLIIHAKSIKMSDKKIRTLTRKIIGFNLLQTLSFLSVQKIKPSFILIKLLKSIVLSISIQKINIRKLYIKQINVDKGRHNKRLFPRSQGRVNYIKKKKSHITITLNVII